MTVSTRGLRPNVQGFPPGESLARALAPGPDARFADAQALEFVLDQLPVGIVLMDAFARVVWTNRPARERIEAGEPLVLRDGRLVAHSHAATLALRRLVERACGAGCTGAARDPEVLTLSASATGCRLVIVARPVERLGAPTTQDVAQAVVFLSDDEHQLCASRQRLRQLFDLTPAESELTALLAGGSSLRAAAERLAITPQSARTYLKRALHKTGTRRQAELVRLVLSVATAGANEG